MYPDMTLTEDVLKSRKDCTYIHIYIHTCIHTYLPYFLGAAYFFQAEL